MSVYFGDPNFVPKRDDVDPLREQVKEDRKVKMFSIESAAEWRVKVRNSWRRMDELYDWEKIWFRRYLTNREYFGFWKFYFDGVWIPEVQDAVRKIHRNMEKSYVFFG
jgi:hypothetical protein